MSQPQLSSFQWSSVSHQFCNWPRFDTGSWLLQTPFSFPKKSRKTQDSFDCCKLFLFPDIPCQQCDHRYPCAVLKSFPYLIFNLCYLLELSKILFSLKLQTAKEKSSASGKSCFLKSCEAFSYRLHHVPYDVSHTTRRLWFSKPLKGIFSKEQMAVMQWFATKDEKLKYLADICAL